MSLSNDKNIEVPCTKNIGMLKIQRQWKEVVLAKTCGASTIFLNQWVRWVAHSVAVFLNQWVRWVAHSVAVFMNQWIRWVAHSVTVFMNQWIRWVAHSVAVGALWETIREMPTRDDNSDKIQVPPFRLHSPGVERASQACVLQN